MKKVFQKDGEFLADVSSARKSETLDIWWLGQSGFLIHAADRFVLLDPYLSDSLTKKYADTDKPHIRISERVIAPESLDFIDVITSSHNHTDHLDAETLTPIIEANPSTAFVLPEANRSFAAERLCLPAEYFIGLDDGESITIRSVTITGIAAAHEEIDRDAQGQCTHLGYVIHIGPYTVYHSGDTVLFDGLIERLRPYEIDVALLPINGRAPERRVAGNLNGAEAVWLSREIRANVVIPCHFDMFEFNTVSPQSFINEAHRLGQNYRALEQGERFSYSRRSS